MAAEEWPPKPDTLGTERIGDLDEAIERALVALSDSKLLASFPPGYVHPGPIVKRALLARRRELRVEPWRPDPHSHTLTKKEK